MVKSDDIKNIVTDIVLEIKDELKKETRDDHRDEWYANKRNPQLHTTQMKYGFIKEKSEKTKIFKWHTKEIADRINMDMNDLKEKFHEQLADLQNLIANLQQYKSSNPDSIHSGKPQDAVLLKINIIKFIGWKEKAQEDLCSDLIAIIKHTAGVAIQPSDILEIHRMPGNREIFAQYYQTQKQWFKN